jgi:hypothetical protein
MSAYGTCSTGREARYEALVNQLGQRREFIAASSHSHPDTPRSEDQRTEGEAVVKTSSDCFGAGLTSSCRNMNSDGETDLESLASFVSVDSDFYPQLGNWYDDEAEELLRERLAEREPS